MSIRIEKLHYIYPDNIGKKKEALCGIDLLFEDHCFTALIGKTGSGKSTLLQHLNGLFIPTYGKITVCDYTIDLLPIYKKNGKIDEHKMKKLRKKKRKDIKTLRKKVGLVFQFPEYQLFEETVLKDVAFGPKNFGLNENDAISDAKEALSLVGLDESFYERSPFELSGGEKRRVAIAGILALHPDVLVLDEPTVGLDASSEANLMSLIVSLYEKGVSIVLATHNMDVVLKYANRAIVLDKGKVVSDSTPLELFQNKEFLKTSSLEPPKVFSFALSLIEHDFDVDLSKINDIDTLADEIVRLRK